VRAFGKPAFDQIRAMPYLELQSGSDSRLAHGIRFYGKSGFITELTPQVIERVLDTFASASPGSFSIVLQGSGGAIARKPVGATAFPNRRANHWLMISKSWRDASEDTQRVQALRTAWKSLEPLTSGFYVNGITDDEQGRVATNYGSNYPRLQQIKRKYDPKNQFRLNANIAPG
jgi:hypothetical protein